MIEEYAINTKLCPQIHLPVQSGSNRLLKLMRRSYTRETYLKRVDAIRKVCPDIAISTDIIVGFPGETDKDFEATLSLIREVKYYNSFSFSFSPRPNTEAMTFKDDVPHDVKKMRLKFYKIFKRNFI
ncbi:MAG: radical SAM protein [Deltaproteobacteria bacterium]|nr:MAG: radical SAM protein [Deltaproteobacteria bacterium]